MVIGSHQCIDDECYETQVIFRSLARSHQQDAGVRTQRPVVVFARSVDTFERFFVEQYTEAVAAANFAHQGHDQQVVVIGQVALFEDRGQLKLIGRYFVVARFYGDAQFQCFHFQIFHESGYAGGDGTKVMVFELLVLGAVMPHQGTSGQQQVRTGGV